MFDSTLSAVISIDTDTNTVHFYTDDLSKHIVVNCRCRAFDDELFDRFDKAIKSFQQKYPMASLAKTSVILPDHVFLTDLVNIPAFGKKAMQTSLELAIGAVYKNKNDLRYSTYLLSQNKQFATYGVVGVRKDLLDKIKAVCAANQVGVQNVTFATNAAVNGALSLNAKLKNATFLLMDIQEEGTKLALVNKGRTMGTYRLPFGKGILYKSRLASEDLLFDHATGDLLVLNAKEKAKAKQLTMMGEEILVDPDSLEKTESENIAENGNLFGGVYPDESRKTARKLPKFMQREMPSDKEGFIYENFRIFMKWALGLVANNTDIIPAGALEGIYVNLPGEYDFLYDMINKEAAENGVRFMPLLTRGSDAYAAEKLDLYGGFYVKQYNKINNF